jgi:hypothetical protein
VTNGPCVVRTVGRLSETSALRRERHDSFSVKRESERDMTRKSDYHLGPFELGGINLVSFTLVCGSRRLFDFGVDRVTLDSGSVVPVDLRCRLWDDGVVNRCGRRRGRQRGRRRIDGLVVRQQIDGLVVRRRIDGLVVRRRGRRWIDGLVVRRWRRRSVL